jgi:hypothetical protein
VRSPERTWFAAGNAKPHLRTNPDGRRANNLDKIVLVPEGEELRIQIHGALAGILELCQQSKTPDRSRASAEQIKVVAGACSRDLRSSQFRTGRWR